MSDDATYDDTASPGAPLYSGLMLLVGGCAWLALAAVMMFVVPAQTERYMMIGADLPLPTVMLINGSDLFANFWFVLVPGMVVGGVGAVALVGLFGHDGWCKMVLTVFALAGVGALLMGRAALNLADAALIRSLDGPPGTLARAALPLRSAEGLAWEPFEGTPDGPRLATHVIRVDLTGEATVEQANAVIELTGGFLYAADPDEGWMMLYVEDAESTLATVRARPGVADAIRPRVPTREEAIAEAEEPGSMTGSSGE